MKKVKEHFCGPSTRQSVRPVPSNSAYGLAVVCEHWTPKGDCKVTGNKEIPSNIKEIPLKLNRHKNSKIDNSPSIYMRNPFKNESYQKKVHQKIEIAFNFIREIPLKINRTKILHRVPFY